MSLTQIEKNIINALGRRGAMGVRSLMPLVAGLTSKTQLKNQLEELQSRKLVKQQQNGQWHITRTDFKSLSVGGLLNGASELPPIPPSYESDEKPLKKEPAKKEVTQPVAQPNADEERPAESTAPQRPAEEVLFKLMRTIPAGITIQIDSSCIAVNWKEQRYEPSIEELANVLDAIDTLQQHAA